MILERLFMRGPSLFLFLLLCGPALALEADEQLPDAALEARARSLSKEIRCMVCQAESIDDSQALLAQDMRRYVRAGITAGKSDAAILADLQAKYGDKVLMSPPVRGDTLLLWLAPGVLLLVASGIALSLWRRA